MSSLKTALLALVRTSVATRRDVAWTGAGYLVPVLLSVGTSIVVARMLGAEGRGTLAAIQLLPTVGLGFATLGLPHALTYFIAREPARTGEYLGTALALALAASTIAAVGLAIAQPYFLSQFGWATQWTGVAFCLFLPVNAAFGLPLSAFASHRKLKTWNILRLMPQFVYALVIGAGWIAQTTSAEAITLWYLAILVLVVPWITIRAYALEIGAALSFAQTAVPKLLKYGAMVVLTTAPGTLYSRLDQALIAVALAPTDLGRYVIGVSWAGLVLIPAQVIGVQALTRLPSADRASAKRLVGLAVLAGTVVILIVGTALGMAVTVVPLIFGKDFSTELPAFRLLVVAGSGAALAQVLADCLRGLGRPGIPAVGQWTSMTISAFGLWMIYDRSSLNRVASVSALGALSGLCVLSVGLWWCLRNAPTDPEVSD